VQTDLGTGTVTGSVDLADLTASFSRPT